MPNIVFASNNITHWPNTGSSTDTTTFDSSRVPYSFELASRETMLSPVFVPVTGDVTWFHFRLFPTNNELFGNLTLISGFDTNGVLLFDVRKRDNTSAYILDLILYTEDGGVNQVGLQIYSFNRNRPNDFDLRYEASTDFMSLTLYVNGAQAGETTIAANTPGWGKPVYVNIGAAFCDTGGNDVMNLSEIIIADGDTRNARLNLLRPTTEGGETDWVGEATVLSDDDPTTGVTTLAVDQRHTLNLDAYTGAANISAVVIATQSLAGVGGPQNMRHTVRMSTVNYDSPSDIPIDPILHYTLTDFNINPATSLPWEGGDLATMEMGFVSKT